MTSTIDVLFDDGHLRVGDRLQFNLQRSLNGTKADRKKVERIDDEAFWECVVTDRTASSQMVRYAYDRRSYRLTALATQIGREIAKDGVEYTTGAVDYWCHPRYAGDDLWTLRKRIE